MTRPRPDTRQLPPSPLDTLTELQRRLAASLAICAENGDAEGVVRFLALGGDPKIEYSNALRMAAMNGHAECVRLLIPSSEPRDLDSWALGVAASLGHAECVRLLIPVSNPRADDCLPLRSAAKHGRAECVALLIPVSDPLADDCRALRSAAKNGHAECARLLIPVSSPLAELDGILPASLVAGHADVVDILLEREPRLLHGINVFTERASARARGHQDLEALLSSIIDRQAIIAGLSAGEPRRGAPHARL